MSSGKVKGGLSGHQESKQQNRDPQEHSRVKLAAKTRDNKSVERIEHQMVVPMQEGTVDRVTVVVPEDY